MTAAQAHNPDIRVDLDAFAREVEALRAELDEARGPECRTHLRKMERWGRACTALGYATAWLGPNPVSVAALSLGRTARWTMIAHHVSHRGYDKVPGMPQRLTSRGFARGRRRLLDWLDWIEPEAWNQEHNLQHHYNLGEDPGDPDLVQRNLDWLRESSLPDPLKVALVAFYMGTWKPFYYAPSTTVQLHEARARRIARKNKSEPESVGWIWNPLSKPGRDLVLKSWLFYGGVTFGAIPVLFAPLGPLAVGSVAINSALAEVVTNVHTFIIITTNHTGDDLPVFEEERHGGRAEFYIRQIAGSVNFRTGGDLNDFLHGWLNYQIEHHVWPDLTMRQYRLAQPRLKALCEKYGVPYLQESVWTRLRKTVRVMIGRDTQRLHTIRDLNPPEAPPNADEPQLSYGAR
ncbi:MAG: fatty acid desaturase [Myxococcota bacterium]